MVTFEKLHSLNNNSTGPTPPVKKLTYGVFVTGTDTGIGKTLTCAILAKAWKANYWKPFQSGLADEIGDTSTVETLAQLESNHIFKPAYELQASLSPMAAAELEEMTVSTDHIELPSSDAPLIVEGAGGLYVPLNEEKMIIDIIKQLDLPVILVARSTLGTINHTLLSLRALAEYNIPVAGVVLSGPINSSNRKTIEQFGNVRVIFEIPQFDEITPAVVNDFASTVENFESTLLPLKK